MKNRSKVVSAAIVVLALPLLLSLASSADADPAGWVGSPDGVGTFLATPAAMGIAWTPEDAAPEARQSHPNSARGSTGKNCSTKTGRIVCCSTVGTFNICTSGGRVNNCSAYNMNPESSEFCSVMAPNARTSCTTSVTGFCSATTIPGGGGGKVHCSVSQGSNSDCSVFGGGTCTTQQTANRCSVFGQASSPGPCQG